MKINQLVLLGAGLFSLHAVIFSAEKPLTLSAQYDLRLGPDAATFFHVMEQVDGIKDSLDADYVQEFKFPDSTAFRKVASNFEHLSELERKLKQGAKSLDKAIDAVAGKKVTVNGIYGQLYGSLKRLNSFKGTDHRRNSRLAGALTPLVAMAAGRGVLVQLDDDTYCYNVGYAKGTEGKLFDAEGNPITKNEAYELDKMNRRTGRSYGASETRKSYDPTDRDYLTDLANYVAKASDKELEAFYRTVFELLLKSQGGRIDSLNKRGETVIADYFAIYMAELLRHLMTGLKRYEWENALTEITMIAAYSVHPEGITLDPRGSVHNKDKRGTVISGLLKPYQRLLGYFGVGTDGSGLDGRNKKRRHQITKAVSRAQRKLNGDLAKDLRAIIGDPPPRYKKDKKTGHWKRYPRTKDLYNDVMEYFINNPKEQDAVAEHADEVIDLLVGYLMSTRKDAAKITKAVKKTLKPDTGESRDEDSSVELRQAS